MHLEDGESEQAGRAKNLLSSIKGPDPLPIFRICHCPQMQALLLSSNLRTVVGDEILRRKATQIDAGASAKHRSFTVKLIKPTQRLYRNYCTSTVAL